MCKQFNGSLKGCYATGLCKILSKPRNDCKGERGKWRKTEKLHILSVYFSILNMWLNIATPFFFLPCECKREEKIRYLMLRRQKEIAAPYSNQSRLQSPNLPNSKYIAVKIFSTGLLFFSCFFPHWIGITLQSVFHYHWNSGDFQ